MESIDKASLGVLSRIKKIVNQQEVLERINPTLKSFFMANKHCLGQALKLCLKCLRESRLHLHNIWQLFKVMLSGRYIKFREGI